ncbi:MAG: diacylglycerol/lipid kinase family protein [Opitutales bacterium]
MADPTSQPSTLSPPTRFSDQALRVSLLFNLQSGSTAESDPDDFEHAFTGWVERHAQWSLHQHVRLEGDFDATVDQLLSDPPDLCVVAGGDGTIAGLTAKMVSRNIDFLIGVVPFGTINLFSRDLNLPGDPEVALTVLDEAEVAEVDYASVNDAPVLCSSIIGFPAKVSERREEYRGRLSGLNCFRFIGRVIRILAREAPYHAEIKTEQKTLRIKTRFIGVSHNDVKETIGTLPQRDRLDTGRLHIYTLAGVSWWHYAGLALRFADGSWKHSPRVMHLEAQEATIQLLRPRQRVKLINDGEIDEVRGPLHYRIQPRRLRFLRLPQSHAS